MSYIDKTISENDVNEGSVIVSVNAFGEIAAMNPQSSGTDKRGYTDTPTDRLDTRFHNVIPSGGTY